MTIKPITSAELVTGVDAYGDITSSYVLHENQIFVWGHALGQHITVGDLVKLLKDKWEKEQEASKGE